MFFNGLMTGKILKKESVEQMTNLIDSYGFGIGEMTSRSGRKAIGHDGAIDEFRSVVSYLPNEKVSFVILSNYTKFQPLTLVDNLEKIYFGDEFTLPEFKEPISYNSEELSKYLGTYKSQDIAFSLGENLVVTSNGKQLELELVGYWKFPVVSFKKDVFTIEEFGVDFEFLDGKATMKAPWGKCDFIK